MADEAYWDWYANAFGQQPKPAAQPLPQVSDWPAFYQSVGIPSSGVGQPPATRTVQAQSVPGVPQLPRPRPNTTQVVASYPTGPAARQPVQSVPVTPRIPQSFAGQETSRPAVRTAQLPTQQQLIAATGFTGPRAIVPTRLTPSTGTDYNPVPTYPAPIQSGGLSRDAIARQLAANTTRLPPVQPSTMVASSPESMPQVATQLDTTPPSLPAAPDIGGFDPSLIRRSPIGSTAPKPDFQLPGIFGMIQQGWNNITQPRPGAAPAAPALPRTPMSARARAWQAQGPAQSINSLEGGSNSGPKTDRY